MERDYLRAWNIFENEVQALWPKMEALIMQSRDDLEGQLHCLSAMSACKIDKPDVRLMLLDNISFLLKDEKNHPRVQSLIDGVYGIAMQGKLDHRSKDVAQKLYDKLSIEAMPETVKLSFDQKLDVLWSSCCLGNEQDSILVR